MKIATHFEMTHKTRRLAERIAAGEAIATWSVQTDEHRDDLFNGTYLQCVKAAAEMVREGWDIVGIALVELDEKLGAVYCHDYIALERQSWRKVTK